MNIHQLRKRVHHLKGGYCRSSVRVVIFSATTAHEIQDVMAASHVVVFDAHGYKMVVSAPCPLLSTQSDILPFTSTGIYSAVSSYFDI